MADDAQLMDDAIRALRQIQREYRNERLGELAGLMAEQLRPTMAFDSDIKERERIYEKTPEEFAKEVANVLAKKDPAYQSEPFKCLDDFKKCKQHYPKSKWHATCRVLFTLCVAQKLIPLTK